MVFFKSVLYNLSLIFDKSNGAIKITSRQQPKVGWFQAVQGWSWRSMYLHFDHSYEGLKTAEIIDQRYKLLDLAEGI